MYNISFGKWKDIIKVKLAVELHKTCINIYVSGDEEQIIRHLLYLKKTAVLIFGCIKYIYL